MNQRTLIAPHGGVVVLLIIALVVVASILLHVMFSQSMTNLTVELLAASVAVVLVVASVGVTIHFQSQAETERQYRVCLFENKMKEYTKFLEITAKADDDDRIEDHEIHEIRNQARVLAMLAEREVVVQLAAFITTVAKTRRLQPPGPLGKGGFKQVIISMREDLGVVDETTKEVEEAIGKLVLNS